MPTLDLAPPLHVARHGGFPPVLACGALTTGLDLAVAVAYWTSRGSSGERVLQSIAGWLLGPSAYAGGWVTALAGAALYLCLMCAVAAGYRRLVARHPDLHRRPVLHGALYGATMYLLVFGVVVPALTLRPAFGPPDWIAVCALAWMLLIGVPCALFARVPRR